MTKPQFSATISQPLTSSDFYGYFYSSYYDGKFASRIDSLGIDLCMDDSD